MKEIFIKEFSEVINNNKKKNIFFQRLIISLFEYYKMLSSNIFIDDYYISNKRHFLSLKKGEEGELINIELNGQYLELRFLHHEQMFFSDNKDFLKNFKELLNSFFLGKYQISLYKNASDVVVLKEINWQSEELSCFNEKYKPNNQKNYVQIEQLEGVNYIENI